MRFDFDHIDPRTGLPEIKKQSKPEDKIQLMTRTPAHSCWIKMLQNRVLLQSVGNVREAETVWFDRRTFKVSKNASGKDGVLFRDFRLKSGQRPQGWIECNEHGQIYLR